MSRRPFTICNKLVICDVFLTRMHTQAFREQIVFAARRKTEPRQEIIELTMLQGEGVVFGKTREFLMEFRVDDYY
jgi:hypothetical protein